MAVLFVEENVAQITMVVLLLVGLEVSGGLWPSSLMSDRLQTMALYAPFVQESIAIRNILMDTALDWQLLCSALSSSAMTTAALSAMIYIAVRVKNH